MPEIGERLWRDLRRKWNVEFDEKQSIGKRYARMDEAGTPFCFTIDSQTLQDGTLTVRHRDDQRQERVAADRAAEWLAAQLEA
jgi:glycyl-tRNA synthetase